MFVLRTWSPVVSKCRNPSLTPFSTIVSTILTLILVKESSTPCNLKLLTYFTEDLVCHILNSLLRLESKFRNNTIHNYVVI